MIPGVAASVGLKSKKWARETTMASGSGEKSPDAFQDEDKPGVLAGLPGQTVLSG